MGETKLERLAGRLCDMLAELEEGLLLLPLDEPEAEPVEVAEPNELEAVPVGPAPAPPTPPLDEDEVG